MNVENPIFYSPDVKNLYKSNASSSLDGHNQQIFIQDRFYDYMGLAQQRHDDILEKLHLMGQWFHQYANDNGTLQSEMKNKIVQLMNWNQTLKTTLLNEMQVMNEKAESLFNLHNSLSVTLENRITQQHNQFNAVLKNQEKLPIIITLLEEFSVAQNKNQQNIMDQMTQKHTEQLKAQTVIKNQLNENVSELYRKLDSVQEFLNDDLKKLGFNLIEFSKDLFPNELNKASEKLLHHQESLHSQFVQQLKDSESSLDTKHHELSNQIGAMEKEILDGLIAQYELMTSVDSQNAEQYKQLLKHIKDSQNLVCGELNLASKKLHDHQEYLHSHIVQQLKDSESSLDTKHHELSNQIGTMEKEILDGLIAQYELMTSVDSQNAEQYKQLLQNTNDILKFFKNPYQYFKLGNRIKITDRNGNDYSGIYIKHTENEIIWVNSATNSLSISNKTGLTVSKEY